MLAPRAARRFILAASLMVAAGACSSKDRRDQFYGTDVGVGWDATPLRDASPDAPATTGDGAVDAGTDAAVDAGEAGAVDAPDAGADAPSLDAPVGDTI
jgi:hypothetical protein